MKDRNRMLVFRALFLGGLTLPFAALWIAFYTRVPFELREKRLLGLACGCFLLTYLTPSRQTKMRTSDVMGHHQQMPYVDTTRDTLCRAVCVSLTAI